jgi:hypothetical protein
VLDRHGRVTTAVRRSGQGRGRGPAALDCDRPPLRLAFGENAVDGIAGALQDAKAELSAWERVGRSPVFG